MTIEPLGETGGSEVRQGWQRFAPWGSLVKVFAAVTASTHAPLLALLAHRVLSSSPPDLQRRRGALRARRRAAPWPRPSRRPALHRAKRGGGARSERPRDQPGGPPCGFRRPSPPPHGGSRCPSPPTYLYNTLRSDTPVVVPLPYFASSVSERPLSGPGSHGPFSELRVFAKLVTTVSSCLRFCVYCPEVFWRSPLMVRVFVSYPVFPSVISFLCITRTCE
jgi:hypothetical protein